jgi:hypothetical protein
VIAEVFTCALLRMIMMNTVVATAIAVASSVWWLQQSFTYTEAFSFACSHHIQKTTSLIHKTSQSTSSSALNAGVGVASTYSWKEEQFEIELTISVPPQTSAKHIKFKCSSDAIDLRLKNIDADAEEEKILLDGKRKMRGKICVDGTFWSIADAPISSKAAVADGEKRSREITIAIEKHFVPVSTIGGQQTYDTATDFDWGGIYPNDEEEVTHRQYDEPEELDVREYAAKLGVDIDNLDMSKVDKTMFGAGLSGGNNPLDGSEGGEDNQGNEASNSKKNKNGFHFDIEQATLDQLTRSGLAKEIVQQADGTEYNLDDETEFSMLGKDILAEELREAGIVSGSRPVGSSVPDIWQQASVPVEEVNGFEQTYEDGIIEQDIVEREGKDDEPISDSSNDNENAATESTPQTASLDEDKKEEKQETNEGDPIDSLTVVKLKEVLKAQGLKTSGTKQVLRDRLRKHVETLLQEE